MESFRFREHPGDMFRGTLIQEFPDPEKDFEEFLVQFLPCYQRDDEVAYLDDLYKLLYDEYEYEEDKNKFVEYCGLTENEEIKKEIDEVREELKVRAFENFYDLIKNNKIEVLENYGKN